MKKFILFLTLSYVITGLSQAQTASSPQKGSGSSDDPYQISTLDNLYWLSQNSDYWGSYFIQTEDIDASSTSSWDNGSGFSPVGNNTIYFTGQYNGKGHTISGLCIKRSLASYIGLFGFINNGAEIDSLGLINVNITGGYSYNGGLVGQNAYSTIKNCYTSGIVTGYYYTGGLVGYSNYQSTVSYCYSTVNVTGLYYIGGLVGYGYNQSTISNSYATGGISGSSYTGGLTGYSTINSVVTNCYATGSVSGSSYTGGLMGGNNSYSAVTACYASGPVSGSSCTGGLIGINKGSSTVSNCYWDAQASSIDIGLGSDNNNQSATGLTTSQMKEKTNFSNWDSISTWAIRTDSTYPALRNLDNAPFAFPDTVRVSSGNQSMHGVKLSVLLGNDYDYETIQTSLVANVSSISGGTVSSGRIFFSPDLLNGDSSTFTVQYRAGEVRSAQNDTLWGNKTTSLLILKDQAPAFESTSFTTKEDTPAKNILADDAEHDTLFYTIIANAVNGSVSFKNDSLVYTPNPDFNGIDSLQVAVSDGLLSDTAWIHFTITPVNDAPVLTAVKDMTINEDESFTLSLSDVTATDVDGDVLSLIIDEGDNYSVSGDTITPAANYNGTLYINLAVTDGVDTSNVKTMAVTVNPVTDTYYITASAGEGGNISPYGEIAVDEASSQSFTITASTGYAVSDVSVDGISQGAVNTYTFINVTANHTIIASFTQTTGIDNANIPAINIYPNPCSAGFTIHAGVEAMILKIFNANGELFLTQQVCGTSYVSTENLKPGIYFVNLNGKSYMLVKK